MAGPDTRMVSQAYEKFVNAVAVNPSSFHQELEQFAPLALQGVRIAFKAIPPLRNSVVTSYCQIIRKITRKMDSKTVRKRSLPTIGKFTVKTNGARSIC